MARENTVTKWNQAALFCIKRGQNLMGKAAKAKCLRENAEVSWIDLTEQAARSRR